MIELSAQDTMLYLSHLFNPNVNKVPLLTGKSGIGKSAIMRQVGRAIGYDVKVISLSTKEKTDISGAITVNNGRTVFNPPRDIPLEGDTLKRPVIIFFDELQAASLDVQKSVYSIINERQIDNYLIHQDVYIAAARNTVDDGGFDEDLPAPLMNRMVQITMSVSADDWLEWAVKEGISPSIRAYVAIQPNKLHIYEPSNADPAFPSPRSYTMLSEILRHRTINPDNKAHRWAAYSCIGTAIGSELMAFAQNTTIPNIKDILKNPDSLDLFNISSDAQYFLAMALVDATTDDTLDAVLRILKKYPKKEMQYMMLSQIIHAKRVSPKVMISNPHLSSYLNEPNNARLLKKIMGAAA